MGGHKHESTNPMFSADKFKKKISTKQAFPLHEQLTGEINWFPIT
jgi:hypothetical protein